MQFDGKIEIKSFPITESLIKRREFRGITPFLFLTAPIQEEKSKIKNQHHGNKYKCYIFFDVCTTLLNPHDYYLVFVFQVTIFLSPWYVYPLIHQPSFFSLSFIYFYSMNPATLFLSYTFYPTINRNTINFIFPGYYISTVTT